MRWLVGCRFILVAQPRRFNLPGCGLMRNLKASLRATSSASRLKRRSASRAKTTAPRLTLLALLNTLGDPRRLNVALTRARYMLKIFGNYATLASSPIWASLMQDARNRRCYVDAANRVRELNIAPKQLVAAKREEIVSHLRVKATGKPATLTEGINAPVDIEIDIDSVWKVVFTKTCKQQIQSLNRATALNLVKCFDVFAKGYPARSIKLGFAIRGRSNYIRKILIKDRTLLWSVRVLPDAKTVALDQKGYSYTQSIWLWAYPVNNDVSETVRSIEIACCSYTDQYLDLCAAEKWVDDRAIPVHYDMKDPIIERQIIAREAYGGTPTIVNELDLVKAYEIDPRVRRALIAGFLSRFELPFVLSSEETALVHDHDSTFVIGRSGTVSRQWPLTTSTY
jgi:hypothetical protein